MMVLNAKPLLMMEFELAMELQPWLWPQQLGDSSPYMNNRKREPFAFARQGGDFGTMYSTPSSLIDMPAIWLL